MSLGASVWSITHTKISCYTVCVSWLSRDTVFDFWKFSCCIWIFCTTWMLGVGVCWCLWSTNAIAPAVSKPPIHLQPEGTVIANSVRFLLSLSVACRRTFAGGFGRPCSFSDQLPTSSSRRFLWPTRGYVLWIEPPTMLFIGVLPAS